VLYSKQFDSHRVERITVHSTTWNSWWGSVHDSWRMQMFTVAWPSFI